MSKDYIYAVTRIRGRELDLFNEAVMEQLLATKSYDEALRFLADKGWGEPDRAMTASEMLDAENDKIWQLMNELTDDMSVFDVFRVTNDYHNVKAAVKLAYVHKDMDADRLFVTGGTVEPSLIRQAVEEKNYDLLPEQLAEAAQEAYDTLLHTGDGQLCDMILDCAALEAVRKAGNESDDEVMQEYAAMTVASSDIKIAARCAGVGKPLDFIRRALAPCDDLNVESLAMAAVNGVDSIAEYLSGTDYAGGADALKESPAAFERWCDNLITEHMKPQKSNTETAGPLAAYILARQNEIKCVRMILSGKLNGLPDEVIRERLRETYV